MYVLFCVDNVLFYVLLVCVVLCIVFCKCVLYYCHRVANQLQLNISYHIIFLSFFSFFLFSSQSFLSRSFRIVAKSACYPRHVHSSVYLPVCLSAHSSFLLSTRISTVPIGDFLVKFDIEDFYENLSRKTKFD